MNKFSRQIVVSLFVAFLGIVGNASAVNLTDIRNLRGEDVFVSYENIAENGSIHGWKKIAPGQTEPIFTGNKACFAISVNGRDYYGDRIAAGITNANTYGTMWVHPTDKFDLTYQRIINGARFQAQLPNAVKLEATATTAEIPQRLAFFGLVTYRCQPVQGNALLVVE